MLATWKQADFGENKVHWDLFISMPSPDRVFVGMACRGQAQRGKAELCDGTVQRYDSGMLGRYEYNTSIISREGQG